MGKNSPKEKDNGLGLVLSAGGARGAYEGGIFYYLRSALPKKLRRKNFSIQTGSSIGALNTLGIASLAEDPELQGKRIKELWLNLKPDHIYRRDWIATTELLVHNLGGMLKNLITFHPMMPSEPIGSQFHSLLDTRPLHAFLKRTFRFKNISKNIREGTLNAVAVTANNLHTGQNEIFLQKKSSLPYRGEYLARQVEFEPHHALAASAIPIVFPPIKVGDCYYGDGGIRLFTPLSPALDLGARRLILIELRHRVSPHTVPKNHNQSHKEPTVSQQMGHLLTSMLTDRIEAELAQLRKLNEILEVSEDISRHNYLKRLNREMNRRNRKKAKSDIRKVEVVDLFPSEHLSQVFRRWFEKMKKGSFHFSIFERLMVQILNIDPITGMELMSYLIFAPEYLKDLFELGYRDAEKNRGRLMEILKDE